MIDRRFLLPPGSGLRTNPVLFGVSEGLAQLLPLPDDTFVPPWPSEAMGAGAAPPPPSQPRLSETRIGD